jgi:tRNA nucleotidyltransferase (CCA-adding enzyme)
MIAAAELPDRLRAAPGMDRLLPALAGLGECFLVGGAVRDLLLGSRSLDIDIAVEGDAEELARHLAARLDGEVRAHSRFGTATAVAAGLHVDIAATRRERYAAPGALPEVEPAGLAEDLARRDFTINALALVLADGEPGRIVDPHGGQADLEAGLVRVLHAASFIDDPTRLLRALRYSARFDFKLEAATERLAREALASGALTTVSGPRTRDELLDLLAEETTPRAVGSMRDLGLDLALHPALGADPELVASAQLGAIETGADPALAALAALCVPAPDELEPWVERLGLTVAPRDAVLRAARSGPQLAARLTAALRPSELYALLAPEPPEALALALALHAPAEPVLDFVSRLRGVRLEITGDDLRAAGVPESPALGAALERTLARKLDGELSGRDDELRAALEIVAGEA